MIWLVLVLLLLLYVFYNRWSWTHSYWEFRAIPGPSPLPFVGNLFQTILDYKSLGELALQWSRQFADAPLIGYYSFMQPCVLVNSLDYVKTILTDEFPHFTARLPVRFGHTDSEKFLSTSSGSNWKSLRSILEPIFDEAKRRGMANKFVAGREKAMSFVDKNLSKDVSAAELIKPYAIEVSASNIFGLDIGYLSEFTKQYEKATDHSGKKRLNKIIYNMFPKLADFMGIAMILPEQERYFKKILQESFKNKKATGARTEDVAQHLMELKEKGEVHADTKNETEDRQLPTQLPSTTIKITDDLVANQAIDLLISGVETLYSTITFTLLELCLNQAAMDKLIQEINIALDRHKHLSYQAINDIKYLDMCIMETLRLHPPVLALTRCCTKNYTFDNGQQIEKGMTLCVPILTLHSLPGVYPEPQAFKPERFATVPPSPAYIPFGDGPRQCIGKELGMDETKALLCHLLSRFEVKIGFKTKLPVTLNTHGDISTPRSPIYFNFTPRSQ